MCEVTAASALIVIVDLLRAMLWFEKSRKNKPNQKKRGQGKIAVWGMAERKTTEVD